MTGKRPIQQNGDNERGAKDQLEQVERVLDSSDGNRLLEAVNLGLGFYDEETHRKQMESYRKGLIADTSFGSLLTKRAIDDAKRGLARQGIAFDNPDLVSDGDELVYKPLDPDDVDERQSTWTAERERGEEIWSKLGKTDEAITEEQLAAMVKITGLEPGSWIPMFWDMLIGRHDMSRSIDAELLRDYLGDMRTLRDELSDEDSASKLLGRRV